jgi:predicted N-acyltransferase
MRKRKYHGFRFYPNAVIHLEASSSEEYLRNLDKKTRYEVRKALRIRKEYNLTVSREALNDSIIEEFYTLYSAVNAGAKDIQSPPIAKEYFQMLGRDLPENAGIMTMREKNAGNRLVGGLLILQDNRGILTPWIGMDYDVNRKYYMYYNLFWECICYGIQTGRSYVNCGTTTYFIKMRLGAKIDKTTIYARIKNPVINMFGRYLMPDCGEISENGITLAGAQS